MKRLITGMLAGLMTATAILSLCSCQKSDSIPKGWEVVSQEGAVEFLSLKQDSDRDQKLIMDSLHFKDKNAARYLDLYGYTENGCFAYTKDKNVTMIFYYGATETLDPDHRTDYHLNVYLSSMGKSCRYLTADVQDSDLFDVRVDKNGELYARHAVRITIPASEFEDRGKGELSVDLIGLTWESGTKNVGNVSVNFKCEKGKIWFAPTEYEADLYFRHIFPYVIFEVCGYVIPTITLLAIALFILLLIKNRWVWISYVLCAIGAAYSFASLKYFESLPTSGDMFAGFEYLGQEIVTFFGFLEFTGLLVLFGLIHLIVYLVRRKKAEEKARQREVERKEAIRRAEMLQMEAEDRSPSDSEEK